MLELIPQINIKSHIIRMVGVVQRNLQRTEHAIHAITRTAPEHVFFLQDVLDFPATQRIVSRHTQVMDATDALAELDATYQQGVVHELHMVGTHERQLLREVLLHGIATHHVHLRERNVGAEDQTSADGREDGETGTHGCHPFERTRHDGERSLTLVLKEIVRIQ